MSHLGYRTSIVGLQIIETVFSKSLLKLLGVVGWCDGAG